MIDPISLTTLLTAVGLLIERIFSNLNKSNIKKSKCCGSEIIFKDEEKEKENYTFNN